MERALRISLLTVPVEPDYMDFLPSTARPAEDVFVSSIRSVGQFPIMPKIAIVSLIYAMLRAGYKESNYDFYDVDMLLPSDQELRSYFLRYQPDVVGLSAVVSTCYAQTKRIARILRECCPNSWIVLGGSLTASSNMVLRKTEVDICIVGDGEIAWVDFLEYVKSYGRQVDFDKLSTITGLAFINSNNELQFTGYGKQIPGELNPFPDYEILKAGLQNRPSELQNYFRRGLGSTHFQTDPRSYEPHRRPMLAQLWSSKGCVARCTFCQRSTKGYRINGLDSLDSHLDMLAKDYDVGFIHILDENFGSDNAFARELAVTMKKHDMLWLASGVRVSSVNFEDIKFFKENNCVSLKFGVESGSQKIMDIMEKKFSVERVFETLEHCAKLEMYSPLAVMVGMPGETNETALETGQFLGRLAYMQGLDPKYLGVAIFYALPLTGTPLYVYGQQVGLIGKDPDDEEKFLLSVSGTGAGKANYVNLNGAPIKDVLWWDWLVKLEAKRKFNELVRAKPLPQRNFMQTLLVEDKEREIVGRPFSLGEVLVKAIKGDLSGFKSKIVVCVDEFMEYFACPSNLLTYLPRCLIYPPLKNLVYLQFIFQRWVVTRKSRQVPNLFIDWRPVAPVAEAKTASISLRRSLRSVVKEKDLSRVSKSQTESNQDILSVGL
jgi:radical SAM superfamily enzyme YgiQ (UPF0313 family)